MLELDSEINNYLFYCEYQKELDKKTIRAYRIDLKQFRDLIYEKQFELSKDNMNEYLYFLHKKYKQKTIKRKIASTKAFFHYLVTEDIIESNPYGKIKTKFKEDMILPKSIPLNLIEKLLRYMYGKRNKIETGKQHENKNSKLLLRDIALVELLFATGMRISEICNLQDKLFDLVEGILCIKGKGGKERYLQIGNREVLELLLEYRSNFSESIERAGYFFVNRYGERYSEQSARRMVRKYVKEAGIELYITPHMFRHAFATLLLEEDVDIRYIQKMLGHSSITTTQIYTFVTSKKQKQILKDKHPRNKVRIG